MYNLSTDEGERERAEAGAEATAAAVEKLFKGIGLF
jgi:hypothetical protein